MSQKTFGYVLIALGALLVLAGLLADALGIGAAPGFGWKQIVMVVAGVAVALLGIWLATRKPG